MVHAPAPREPRAAKLHARLVAPLLDRWADSVHQAIPLRGRLAQLVIWRESAARPPTTDSSRADHASWRDSLGGVLLSGASADLLARRRDAHRHGAAGRLPVLVLLDAVPDAAPSVPGGTEFPSWLGLAAAADSTAICAAGRVAAREARVVGAHGWLAPAPAAAPPSRALYLGCAAEEGTLFPREVGVPYLLSADPAATLDSLEAAVAASAVVADAADAAVRRALVVKAGLALLREVEADSATAAEALGGHEADSLAGWLARRSLVLVRDRHLLTVHPLDAPPRRRVLVLTISDEDPEPPLPDKPAARQVRRDSPFVAELRRLGGTGGGGTLVVRDASPRTGERALRLLRDEARRADLVIAALDGMRATTVLRDIVGGHGSVVVAAFGDPSAAAALDSVAALLVAWNATAWSARAAARAVGGAEVPGAALPLTLSPTLAAGTRAVYPRFAAPAAVADAQRRRRPITNALTRALRDSVRRILSAAIADDAFPGAYAIVGTRAGNLVELGVGRLDRGGRARPSPTTVWDLASLTKVVGTTTGVMRLVGAGLVELDAPAQRYLPRWTGADAARVTVRQLLAHSSGLPAGRPLWRDAPTPDSAMALVYATPLDTTPGARTVYSDLGAILLGEIIQAVSGERLDRYLARRVFTPLGMTSTRFTPPAAWRSRIAPTEADAWRERHLRGEVHDENAFRLGGVAGHAGLFTSARDLARFARALLGGGAIGGTRIVPRATLADFTRVQDAARSSRALGWDTPTGTSSAGRLMSTRAYGHTGFTGTSIWIDPANDVFVLLLTNRVNPTRDNPRIFAVRAALADAVMSVLTTPRPTLPSAPPAP